MEEKKEKIEELDDDQMESTAGGYGKIGMRDTRMNFIFCKRCNKIYRYDEVKAAGSIVCSCGSIIH